MKWKLTGRYILSIVIVVILIVFINISILFALLIIQSVFDNPIFQSDETSPEHFVRQFRDDIVNENNQVTITEAGKEALIEKNAWLQILDENGLVIYSYRTPVGVEEKYTPVEIVQAYKYKEINANTTVFIGEKSVLSESYSYFLGIENPYFNRYSISYEYQDVHQAIKLGSIIIIIDILIALMIGYFFSKRLTYPIQNLIKGIKRLTSKDYTVHYESKGIYKDVFHNINFLANQLTTYDKERKELEKMREEWIANVSHDIKTPLTSIQGYAELIKDPAYQFSLEEIQEYAEIIEQNHFI